MKILTIKTELINAFCNEFNNGQIKKGFRLIGEGLQNHVDLSNIQEIINICEEIRIELQYNTKINTNIGQRTFF